MRFHRHDYILASIICFFLGIFMVSQYYSSREYQRLIQPETNEFLAMEVAKLTKTTADLRREAKDLTGDLMAYQNSTQSGQATVTQYHNALQRFATINGDLPLTGQGVIIRINGKLRTDQVVDFVNALRNIGAEVISIRDERITLGKSLEGLGNHEQNEIKAIGNSKLLKSALERKGGIVEQLSGKDVKIQVEESSALTIPAGMPLQFIYAKIVKDE